jgi:hypothetical protein
MSVNFGFESFAANGTFENHRPSPPLGSKRKFLRHTFQRGLKDHQESKSTSLHTIQPPEDVFIGSF